jgi:hypothetical protein
MSEESPCRPYLAAGKVLKRREEGCGEERKRGRRRGDERRGVVRREEER